MSLVEYIESINSMLEKAKGDTVEEPPNDANDSEVTV